MESSSSNLVEIGQWGDGGRISGIFVLGNYAYVADTSNGLEILNNFLELYLKMPKKVKIPKPKEGLNTSNDKSKNSKAINHNGN